MEEIQDEKPVEESLEFVHGQSRRVVVPGEEILEISRQHEDEKEVNSV
jgi:hypothetical protein